MFKKEKKNLEVKRLDLDACKTRLKKLTDATPVKLDVNIIFFIEDKNIFFFFLNLNINTRLFLNNKNNNHLLII